MLWVPLLFFLVKSCGIDRFPPCGASPVFFIQMSIMTSESEDKAVSKSCISSPSAEEGSSRGSMVGNGPLKKGPWTSAEDAILVEYVNKHGEGNWNAVQKHSGLFRCGKSCRLRWANHLRPDLKKGAFTPEEERRIIELHAKMGNKWARMAVELPGRTDNEIKNFWNTRIKRRQRQGLPIYPPDICLQAMNENQQCHNMVTFATGDTAHAEIMPTNNLEIPAVEFKNLELNQELYPSAVLDIPGGSMLDIPGSSLLAQGLGSSCSNSFLFPMAHPPKRIRRSESMFSGCGVGLCDVLPTIDQYQDDGSEKIAESFELSSSSYHHNLNADFPSSSSSYLLPGSHAFSNGNSSSSSEPISWAMKLELPSLQYSTQVGSWGTPSSPLPSLESVDTLIQSPPIERTKSDSISPRNSGLLEAVLYESRTLKIPKSNSCHQISNASVMAGDDADSSSQNLHETEWEIYSDPISPLGRSAASVFSEHTPISGSSLDEHQSVEIMPVKHEAMEYVSKRCGGKDDIQNHMNCSRPDFLLGSNWFGSSSADCGKDDHAMLTDAIGVLLGDDFSADREPKQMGAIESSPQQAHDSGKWDDISMIPRLSENH